MDLNSQSCVCVCVCAVFVQLCGDAVKVRVTQCLRAGQHSCTGSFRAVPLTLTRASRLSISVSREEILLVATYIQQPVHPHLFFFCHWGIGHCYFPFYVLISKPVCLCQIFIQIFNLQMTNDED